MRRYLNTDSLTGLANIVLGGAITSAAMVAGGVLPSGAIQASFGLSELMGSVTAQSRRDIDIVTARVRRQLERDWERWAGLDAIADEGLRASVLQSFDDVLPRIRLDPAEFVNQRFDAAAMADMMLRKAEREMPQVYGQAQARGRDGALAREVLWNLSHRTYATLAADPAFATLISPKLWSGVLSQTDRILDGQKVQDDRIARMEDMLRKAVSQGAGARQSGIDEAALIALASRIAGEVSDADAALRELESAVEIAMAVQARGDGADAVLRQVAEASARGAHDRAAETIDAELDRLEQDHVARKRALLEAALDQDLLRRNAEAAARRHLALAGLEAGTPPDFAAIRQLAIARFAAGRDRGLPLELEIAGALAQVLRDHAATAEERGAALNLAGVVHHTLGERAAGPRHLLMATASFEEALYHWDRDRLPDLWAKAQMNLANSTVALALRDAGNDRLERAIAAYRETLSVRTRAARPAEWARTQMNLAGALRHLAEATGEAAHLETALAILDEALCVRTPAADTHEWAITLLNRAMANRALGALTGRAARIETALADLDQAEAVFEAAEAVFYLGHGALERGQCLYSMADLVPDHADALLAESMAALGQAASRFGPEGSRVDMLLAQGHLALTRLQQGYNAGDGKKEDAARLDLAAASAALIETGHRRGAMVLEVRARAIEGAARGTTPLRDAGA